MPISLVMVKSSDEARIASPRIDLRRKTLSRTSAASVDRIVARSIQAILTLPIWKLDDVRSGMSIASERGPRQRRAEVLTLRLTPPEARGRGLGGAVLPRRDGAGCMST